MIALDRLATKSNLSREISCAPDGDIEYYDSNDCTVCQCAGGYDWKRCWGSEQVDQIKVGNRMCVRACVCNFVYILDGDHGGLVNRVARLAMP